MDKAKENETKKRVLDPKVINRETAAAILQEGIDFYIKYNKPNWLRRKGILPKQRHFNIKPLVAGTLIRISKLLVDMEFAENVKNEDFVSTGIKLMSHDIEPLIEIVALAITNKETKPNKRLLRFIRLNLTTTEMLGIVTFVIRQMDVSSFMSSIALTRGVSLLNRRS